MEWKEYVQNFKGSTVCVPLCFLPVMHSKNYFLCSPYFSLDEKNPLISLRSLKSLDVTKVFVQTSSFEEKVKTISYLVRNRIQVICFLSDTLEDYNYQYTSQKIFGQIQALLTHIPAKYYSFIQFAYQPEWTNEVLDGSFLENLFYFLKVELQKSYSYSFPFWYSACIPLDSFSRYLTSEYIDGLILQEKDLASLQKKTTLLVNFVQN